MRPMTMGVSATLMAADILGGIMTSTSAHASPAAFAINGSYTATSDGVYATTNYAFHPEATVTSTWTITSTCNTDVKCNGQVTSDQGWSAPLRTEGHVWYVEHDVPDWQTCADGATYPGHETFMFYPANANGVTQIGSPYLEGRDKTVGPRDACSTDNYGKPLTIVMQFRLDRRT